MNADDFVISKIIGIGKHSIIYEAILKRGEYKSTKYAMKRYFLTDLYAINCVLNERKVLGRLAKERVQSPFVTALFYATGGYKTPSLILSKASEFTLFDLRMSKGLLSESQAQFYAAEMICGLEYLHSRGIIHMDIKLSNILLSEMGHVIITDFDLAWGLEECEKYPEKQKFGGTYEYISPEIANRKKITTKADVWCLGALIAHLVCPTFRPKCKDIAQRQRIAKAGYFIFSPFNALSEALSAFLIACLEVNYEQRQEVVELKEKEFFKDVNWAEVAVCRLEPPIKLEDLRNSSTKYLLFDPIDPKLLQAAFETKMPRFRINEGKTPNKNAKMISPDRKTTESNSQKLFHLFKDFNTTIPLILDDESAKVSLDTI